jgi:uncharacterized membrane protein
MTWLLYALLSGLFIGFASFFRKMSTKSSGSLGGFVIEGLVYGVLALLFFLVQQNKSTLIAHPLYSTLSAIALFLGAFFLYKAFSAGALSLTNVLYLAVSLSVVLLISFVFLRESLSFKQMMGIAAGILAIFLLKS